MKELPLRTLEQESSPCLSPAIALGRVAPTLHLHGVGVNKLTPKDMRTEDVALPIDAYYIG